MKTLRNYTVNGALLQADTGPEAQVGDQVQLYLDQDAHPSFPDYIVGTIQHPITKVNCDTATSYSIEYDEADLLGIVANLVVADVIDGVVVTAVEVLDAALNSHLDDTTAHTASNIVNTPAGNIAATTVQAAIAELDAEKQPLDSDLTAYANATDAAARRALLSAAAMGDIVFYNSVIVGLTGGGATKLDGITTVGVGEGRMQIVSVGAQLFVYVLYAAAGVEDGYATILPDDYNASTNIKRWSLITGWNVDGNVAAKGLQLTDTSSGFAALIYGDANLTAPRELFLPDSGGVIDLCPIVSTSSPVAGATVTSVRYVDETLYVTPAGTLATLTWTLPTATNSRIGQIKTFLSTQIITALTVTVLGGGTKAGAALTGAAADEAYSYQCVSVDGSGTWLRIA